MWEDTAPILRVFPIEMQINIYPKQFLSLKWSPYCIKAQVFNEIFPTTLRAEVHPKAESLPERISTFNLRFAFGKNTFECWIKKYLDL